MDVAADTADAGGVNPHYLNHVVATSAAHEVRTTEDIVSGSGVKLLAKGARIDHSMRDRLLQHKLQKPLEDCVQVVGGVVPACFGPIADELLAQHALLASLCDSGRALAVPASLTQLPLALPVQSLLTVYCDYQGDRLRHTVGVAMLALALGRRLFPGDIDRHRRLALAGLVHDVGELYIDPAHLKRGTRLQPEQWRHIVSHPVIGHRVLKDMEGAGPQVAQAVLLHHERLNGFGYPRGIGGAAVQLDGQVLGVAEWLMALIESGLTPLARASVACRLIPGDFAGAIVETIDEAARALDAGAPGADAPTPLEAAVPRVMRIASTIKRFVQQRAWIDVRIAEARGPLRQVLQSGLQRMLRIQTAFSSTGLDSGDPELLLRELSAMGDPQVHLEVMTVIGELEWRLRELERESLLRGSLGDPSDDAVMVELVNRLRPPAAAPTSRPA